MSIIIMQEVEKFQPVTIIDNEATLNLLRWMIAQSLVDLEASQIYCGIKGINTFDQAEVALNEIKELQREFIDICLG